ncbi:MAG: choice-of-anchor L domain-containing protein, partial [Betaproteobacteria bacterium]
MEPVNSLNRIAEDHIGSFGGSIATDPVVPVLLDPSFMGTGLNLWHVTPRRAGDNGHGINSTFDLSRSGANGGDSFYFGSKTTGTVPAGSNGALVSNPFSLGGYSAADVPLLYFTYYLNNSAGNDALRVSVVSPSGTATLIASSNTAEAASPAVTELLQTAASGWRQARLNLGAFANMTGLRLRFEYNAVSANFEGAYVDDVIIGFAERGEMVTGATSNPLFSINPNAAANGVASGDYQLEIRKATEYGTSGVFATSARAATVWGIQPNTQQIVQVDPVTGAIVGQFAAPDALAPGHTVAGLSIAEGGSTLIYVNGHTNGNILYRLDPTTGAILSAETLPTAGSGSPLFRGGLGYESGTIFALDDGQGVERQAGFSGPISVHNTIFSPIPGAAGGDDQGRQFVSSTGTIVEFDPNAAGVTINTIPAPSGQIEGLAFDGVFLYVSDSAGNLITLDPDTGVELNRTVVGGGHLIGLGAAPFGNSSLGLMLNSSIDTNDRLAQQTTLIAPRGADVVEGQTFTISDSVNSVTFEYEDPAIGDGVSASGRIEIRFRRVDPASPDPQNPNYLFLEDYEIAAQIRDAINSPQVQTRFDIRAALADGTVTGTAGRGNKINLFGNAIVEQPPSFGIVRAADGTPQTTSDGNLLRDALLGSNILPAGAATFTGSSSSAGFFEGGGTLLGMSQGIVLSTGNVTVAEGPNNNSSSTGRASGRGDVRLDATFGFTTQDASILEFQFEIDPANLAMNQDDIALNFVFASEEYNEEIGMLGDPTDVVAILIDGVNVAVVPVNAMNEPVSVNSINSGNPSGATGVNAGLFRNNDRISNGAFLEQFGFDGFTSRLTARFLNLAPGLHRIVIAIADVNDQAGDSAIFLDANSLIAYDADLDPTTAFERDPSGIRNVRHEGFGDQNRLRDQGQVLIHSNSITNSADFGVVTDAGERDSIETSFVDGVPVPRLQSHIGPTRRLLELDDLENAGLLGGFA